MTVTRVLPPPLMPAQRERDVPFAVTTITPEAQAAAARVLGSGWVTTGPEVAAFETEFASYVGAKEAVAVASCTAAIELSLRALHLAPGSPVFTSVMTFCGAVHAIVHAGLRPVLVDVDPVTLMPDARTTARAVHLHGQPSAMVVVHFAGHPAPVVEMAAAAGIPLTRVVEDAAHALGACFVNDAGSRPVGSLSAATCFSFYATKNLPIGEGGMVTTDDSDLAEVVRRGRLHGMTSDAWRRYLPGGSWRYSIDAPGLKANMTDVQAAIGRRQLAAFGGWQDRRASLVERYDAGLAGIAGLRTPARPDTRGHAWHLYVVQIGPEFGLTRDQVCAALAARGVGTSVHFIPLHSMPYFQAFLTGADAFPAAEKVFPRILSLPLHPMLSDADVDRVCAELSRLSRATGSIELD